jgi:hypothetical protein
MIADDCAGDEALRCTGSAEGLTGEEVASEGLELATTDAGWGWPLTLPAGVCGVRGTG